MSQQAQDGKDYVVVVNGQRASGILTEQEAQKMAEKLGKPVNEQAGSQSSNVQVKRNLFG